MNKEYFNSTETEGWNKLVELNNEILHLNDLGRTPSKYHTDASGVTCTSRCFNIELKDRNLTIINNNGEYSISGVSQYNKPYTATTIYIEQHKVCDILLDYVVYGYDPIYINFVSNGVIIFNLSNLSVRPIKENKKIKSKGYEKIEIGTREGLDLKDATIYMKNNEGKYELVKRCEKRRTN